MTWTPPPTHELTTPDHRLVRYCLYGPATGTPVVSLPGVPGTRWERPDATTAYERAGLRVLIPDRPGYGGSTRQPGRTVADIAHDIRQLADTMGWARFAVLGHSGGGPHALACTALLPDRVTRCAVVAGIAPPDAHDIDFLGTDLPGRTGDFRLAAQGEAALRPHLERAAPDILARWQATSPSDDGRTQRLRAMFLDSLDGWIDDKVALAHPWGFHVDTITAPVGIWHGRDDPNSPRSHAMWLLSHVPTAEDHAYAGGHEPDDAIWQQVHDWLAHRP